MYIFPIIVAIIAAIIVFFMLKTDIRNIVISIIAIIVVSSIISVISINSQTYCEEVWSGTITKVKHTEEWDEWHEPVYENKQIKDKDGKVIRTERVKIKDGYWEHHYATNKIKTSDDGWKTVDKSRDGTVNFNDKYPNTDKELEKYWKIGTPTASVHSYKNKVQASYSIYNFEDVDLEAYPGLPQYPKSVTNYVSIDRIIGNVPNKQESLDRLAEINSKLNVTIYDEEEKKNKSYKEVNIIFVNMGDVSSDYGFALENYWKGGNKNDFIISFGTDADFNITWAYPITWSESELLKIKVRDYMLDLKNIEDFIPIVNDIASMVEESFERKEFADFEYLNIEVTTGAKILIWILSILIFIGTIFFLELN